MASTAAQNIDTWLRQPYTDADYLSYTRDQTNTESQQHPGNGVVLDRANTVVRTLCCQDPEELQHRWRYGHPWLPGEQRDPQHAYCLLWLRHGCGSAGP